MAVIRFISPAIGVGVDEEDNGAEESNGPQTNLLVKEGIDNDRLMRDIERRVKEKTPFVNELPISRDFVRKVVASALPHAVCINSILGYIPWPKRQLTGHFRWGCRCSKGSRGMGAVPLWAASRKNRSKKSVLRVYPQI